MEGNRQVKLKRFFVESFVICYLASGIAWFVWVSVYSPWYYADARPQDHLNTLVLNILPLSLLPLIVHAMVMVMLRARLGHVEIFSVSSFISAFEVFVFFNLVSRWSLLLPCSEFLFLSLLIAVIPTIVHTILKKRSMS